MKTPFKHFAYTRWHPELHLLTWHPRGILDDDLADQIVEFVQAEERSADEPFHRFTDFNGLAEVRLQFGHAFRIAEQRRLDKPGEKVKSAFFSDWAIGAGLARLYAELMNGAKIEVRAFSNRDDAAEWLNVPTQALLPGA